MFKKRGRQNINRRVRQTEESSEEEPVILRGNRNGKSNDSQINQESTVCLFTFILYYVDCYYFIFKS